MYILLAVLAIAQMGVHLGSMIIMANLNQNMTLNDQMLDMHLQR